MDAEAVRQRLAALADPDRAAFAAPYLGVVPGGYGERDVLLGIPVPVRRRIAREARDAGLADIAALLASPVHEHRFVALVVLVERFRRADPEARAGLSRFYLDHRSGVDNWDLVDVSAPDLLGGALIDGRPRAILRELAGSERVWDRRIAVVATLALIRRGEIADTLDLAGRLVDDPHHLIHKATGWMLREAGKRDEPALVAWLEAHRARMPRTMLRYAIERLPPAARAAMLARAPSS